MVMQRYLDDCLNACLAELLNIPYEEIPPFYKVFDQIFKGANNKEISQFTHDFDEWLFSKGYCRIVVDVKFDKEKCQVQMPYISSDNVKCIGIFQKPDREYSHCVVLHIENNEKVWYEDPSEHSDYDLSDIIQIEVIFKSSLALFGKELAGEKVKCCPWGYKYESRECGGVDCEKECIF